MPAMIAVQPIERILINHGHEYLGKYPGRHERALTRCYEVRARHFRKPRAGGGIGTCEWMAPEHQLKQLVCLIVITYGSDPLPRANVELRHCRFSILHAWP
jgi:hypothetical protein